MSKIFYETIKGPYIKRSTHQENSSTFSTFSVYQSRNNFEDGSHKRIVITKEKIPPIIDQHSLWRCVFCHNKEKCIDGLGELFGPYRIDKSLPEDLTIEYKNGILVFFVSLEIYLTGKINLN